MYRQPSRPETCLQVRFGLQVVRMTLIVVVVQLVLFTGLHAGPGTTPNLKRIVIGRCYDYVTLVRPTSRYDCAEIWREFEAAVVSKAPCSVRVRDYRRMFQATPQALPCDKLLFWSKTRDLVHRYSAATRQFWTLEDTLVGFMFNDLVWCGQEEKDRGFDFSSCPEWSSCVDHPVYSLWKQASQNFAAAACGNVTVVLNGSIPNAFNRKSMFGGVELDSLNPRMVDHVNIKVVANLEGPYVTLMLLQCMKNPRQRCCQTCASSLLNRIGAPRPSCGPGPRYSTMLCEPQHEQHWTT
ncbi:ADP-ribosyl cyclase/cyclic ADP-ribose hydrolase 1-like isoform X2 [Denticeps clupeoides]|uniref:ADP-ribosyl cyclase/cyclic ADP-ribose hydrolase 1-like isoform X2 n=1 Tax=Denticeps clupeoides TaxID=299321 RepID=UPI0010A38237|nr:ADP-ribosyl cyclase/cyclic ADP-ribose hydrolase 1-like isoform X2 [Denticeps clupeoides]